MNNYVSSQITQAKVYIVISLDFFYSLELFTFSHCVNLAHCVGSLVHIPMDFNNNLAPIHD